MIDVDHGEFQRAGDEPYRVIGYSDKAAWDRDGHLYVNDVRVCCRHWWTRAWRAATGDHR